MTGTYVPVFCFRYNPVMKWNRWLGIALVVLSAICLVISIWPASKMSDQIAFSDSEGIAGTLVISQPKRINVGDKSEINLHVIIEHNQNGISPLIFLSKLEINNLTVTPKGEGKVTIDPTKPVMLNWQITPYKSGVHSGTLWLFIDNASGQRNLILARPTELTAKTLFGLSYPVARMTSIIILIIGVVLFLFNNQKKNHAKA
ncbi:MAG: hypothetical protein C0410_11525 [Anaerolinea sp.]|nr:hypothetical protein [Anaerolinea sp.]